MAHLIFIFVAFLIVIISKVMTAARQQPPQQRRTGPRPQPAPDTEEERMRRFMEAVGLPQGGAGGRPPVTRPRPQSQPRPLLPVQPPPGMQIPGRLRRATPPPITRPAPVQPKTIQARPLQPAPIIEYVLPAPAQAPVPAPEVSKLKNLASWVTALEPEAPAAAVRETYSSRSLLGDLRTPATLREAIILREVLGPPKAFQAF
ncbi:MAG TPA: hypothetical protein VHY22_17675 [Chthoniobacteraceae bacterium]|jgi:hypothetical protein|nr:hypothetical protein [Chthoniobacteraceae bacterium]